MYVIAMKKTKGVYIKDDKGMRTADFKEAMKYLTNEAAKVALTMLAVDFKVIGKHWVVESTGPRFKSGGIIEAPTRLDDAVIAVHDPIDPIKDVEEILSEVKLKPIL